MATILERLRDTIDLLHAVALVYSPDRAERRRMAKMVARERKARRVKRDEGARAETGIRTLRQKPIFHTPNVFPPETFEQQDVSGVVSGFSRTTTTTTTTAELQHCYVCKEPYTQIHHFYDQMCPSCAELNFRKRTELADLRGRVALLTGWRRHSHEQRRHGVGDGRGSCGDRAARIVDPIISGFNTGKHVWGQFLKDYQPTDW